MGLASNQVQYSLLYRAPERNGVIQACKETNTALLAYSPITQGLLSGALAQMANASVNVNSSSMHLSVLSHPMQKWPAVILSQIPSCKPAMQIAVAWSHHT